MRVVQISKAGRAQRHPLLQQATHALFRTEFCATPLWWPHVVQTAAVNNPIIPIPSALYRLEMEDSFL